MSKEPSPELDKQQFLEKIHLLEQEDETLYNILAVDIWALAKTMDEFQPGFWAVFMKNRDKALKRFVNEILQQRNPLPPA